MNHALLKIVASAALGSIPTGPDAISPQRNGPDPTTIVNTQTTPHKNLTAPPPFHRLCRRTGKAMIEHVEQLYHSGSRIRRRSGLPTEVQDGRNDHLEFGLVTES